MMAHLRITGRGGSFFTRMLLICTSLLAAFSIIASIVVGFLSSKYEKSQFLKNYDLAMVNLSEAFSSHIESFSILAGRLLVNNKCDENLCSLLEASSYEQVPADTRNHVITLLSSLCSSDRYLRGVLLYSPVEEMLYYYSDSQYHLQPASYQLDAPGLAPYAGTKLDTSTIRDAVAACTRSEETYDSFYGMTATLYRSPQNPLGYLILLYSTLEFDNILENYELDSTNHFVISSLDGLVYFQSGLGQDSGSGTKYTNTLSDRRHDFQVSYEVDGHLLPKGPLTGLIIMLALFVTVFSFLLYFITYYLSNRNINGILKGMQNFSLEELSYRIARPQGKNEFTQIIDGFNQMCDELQKNVERSYVYELQQKKSELYALQTSINPHFLYNTLDMIRSQILYGNTGSASQMLLLLAKIYRAQMNTEMFITLEEEAELCENFIVLYQNRFQNFDYEFDVDDCAGRYALPKNTLQPLIENYFVHGIKSGKNDNLLNLAVTLDESKEGCFIHIILSNNGNEITDEQISQINEKLHSGIFKTDSSGSFALTNVYNRLRIAFGDCCSILLKSGENEIRFQIELTFPARTAEELSDVYCPQPSKTHDPGNSSTLSDMHGMLHKIN